MGQGASSSEYDGEIDPATNTDGEMTAMDAKPVSTVGGRRRPGRAKTLKAPASARRNKTRRAR